MSGEAGPPAAHYAAPLPSVPFRPFASFALSRQVFSENGMGVGRRGDGRAPTVSASATPWDGARHRTSAADPVELPPHYACLLEVVQAVNSTLQLQSVLHLILDRAIEVMQADAGSIMMLDESTGELQVKAARGARAA